MSVHLRILLQNVTFISLDNIFTTIEKCIHHDNIVHLDRKQHNKQMYEELRKEVNWEHNHPTGLILHAAVFDDSVNNISVADI
jgi:hypothetical protein